MQTSARRIDETARETRGFTLIELIVIIAIIGIVNGIAIPNLLDARKSGNESSAIGTLRTLVTAQSLFRDTDRDDDGVADFATDLPEVLSEDLISPIAMTTGTKSGYFFNLGSTDDGFAWSCTAEPVKSTGSRYFYVDDSEIVRYSDGRRADEDDDEYPDPPPPPPDTKAEGGIEKIALKTIRALARTSRDDAIGAAQAILRVPANVDAIIDEFDRNGDRMLSWDEILGTDLLVRVRNLARVLSGLPPPGPEIAPDRKMAARNEALQKSVRRLVKLQQSEIPLPAISTAERGGDPVALLDKAR